MTGKIALSLLILMFAFSTVYPLAKAETVTLINPDFESGANGWYQWNSEAEAAVGEISTEFCHSGTCSGKRWLIEPSGETYSCFIQELRVDLNEGDKISVAGWMMSPEQDPLKGKAEAFLVIEFWKGTEKTASSESAHLNKQSQWDKFEAAGVVPKGTEFVKICCFLTGSKGSIGTVYFDDLQLKINTSTQ